MRWRDGPLNASMYACDVAVVLAEAGYADEALARSSSSCPANLAVRAIGGPPGAHRGSGTASTAGSACRSS